MRCASRSGSNGGCRRRRRTGRALPDGIADVLAVLRSSGIVLDSADSVVNNSPAAVANGLVSGQDLTQPELLDWPDRSAATA